MPPTIWHCHIAMSLDGRIARADGSFDWLEPYPPQEFGIAAFMAGIDAIVMGRATYEIERRHGRLAASRQARRSSSPAGRLPTRRRWSRRGRVIFPLLPTSSRGGAADGSASRAAASSSAA